MNGTEYTPHVPLESWIEMFEEMRDECIADVRILRGSGMAVGQPTTYGEITPHFVEQIIREVGFTADDVFYDIGSGIGNVVLQVATQVGCRSIGIEIRDELTGIACHMQTKLQQLLQQRQWPDQTSHMEFVTGDALSSQFSLEDASIIFLNNWCFGGQLEHALFTKFQRVLQEGTRIICLKDAFPRFRPGSLLCKDLPCQRFQYPWRRFVSCSDAISWDSRLVECVVYQIVDHGCSLVEASSLMNGMTLTNRTPSPTFSRSTTRSLTLQEARSFARRLKIDRFSPRVSIPEILPSTDPRSLERMFRKQRFHSSIVWPSCDPQPTPATTSPPPRQIAKCSRRPSERRRTNWIQSMSPLRPPVFLRRALVSFQQRRHLPRIKHGKHPFVTSKSTPAISPVPLREEHLPRLSYTTRRKMPLFDLRTTKRLLRPRPRLPLPKTRSLPTLSRRPSEPRPEVLQWRMEQLSISGLAGNNKTSVFLRRTLSPRFARKKAPRIHHMNNHPFVESDSSDEESEDSDSTDSSSTEDSDVEIIPPPISPARATLPAKKEEERISSRTRSAALRLSRSEPSLAQQILPSPSPIPHDKKPSQRKVEKAKDLSPSPQSKPTPHKPGVFLQRNLVSPQKRKSLPRIHHLKRHPFLRHRRRTFSNTPIPPEKRRYPLRETRALPHSQSLGDLKTVANTPTPVVPNRAPATPPPVPVNRPVPRPRVKPRPSITQSIQKLSIFKPLPKRRRKMPTRLDL